MFVKGKHVNIHTMLTEPWRCLKCQRFSHYVPDCRVMHDMCTCCSEQHQTSQCNIMDMSNFCWTNCTGMGAKKHGAADRNCAAFKAEKEKIQVWILESKYKYFPTEVPCTWQLLNETDMHTDFKQHQHNSNANWYAPSGDPRNQHGFMNNWNEVRHQHGRPPPPHAELTNGQWMAGKTNTNNSG